MGRLANSYGIRWTVIIGSVMIAIGPFHFVTGRAVAALRRPRPVHGPARQRRIECAAVRLCQPVVRPAPRLGARADLQRRLSRRLRLADHLRALDRVFRLALDHDRICDPAACRSSCRWRSSFCVRRPRSQHETTATAAGGARPKVLGWHPECRVRHDRGGGLPVLRDHVDAAAASGRVLQRPRNFRDRRRDHAVGAARHGLLQPPGLGLAVRPDGRRAHGILQLDPAMRGDERISVHPGRRRPVRGFDRIRALASAR